MYLVVEFLAEKSVAVVPKSWVQNDKCYWPPSKSKRKALVKKVEEPDLSWDLFAVRVHFEYDTYDEARSNLDRAVYESGREEDRAENSNKDSYQLGLVEGSGFQHFEVSVTDEHGSGAYMQPESISQHDLRDISLNEGNALASNMKDAQREQPVVLVNAADLETVTKGIEEVKGTQNIIVDMLLDITSRIKNLEQGNPAQASESTTDVARLELPKTSPEGLETLNNDLEADLQLRRDLTKYLRRKGGKTILEATKMMLSSLFSDELGCRYSMAGARGKLPFTNLKIIYNVILDSLQQNPMIKEPATEAVFNSTLQKCFKLVGDRVQQRLRVAASRGDIPQQ